MNRYRIYVAGFAALIVNGVGSTVTAGPASAAVATTIACGQNVTTDVVLRGDVGPCGGPGFTVHGAHGITIDFNGHRLFGPDNLTAARGIEITNSDDVTVMRGTVSGFSDGIALGGPERTVIQEMDISGNRGGITMANTGPVHAGGGILGTNAHGTIIRRSRITGNGPTAGISIFDSNDVTIEGNVVQGNAVRQLSSSVRPNVIVQVTMGIWIGATTDRFPRGLRYTIRNNQVLDNGRHGINISGFTRDNVIVANQVNRNGLEQTVDDRIESFGDGIHAASLGNLIQDNVVTGNGRYGIEVGFRQNQVRRNVALFNNQSPNTFGAYDLADRITGCDGNIWSMNRYGTINQPCVAG